MSSEFSTKYLTSQDLGMLQQVLSDAGYTDDILIEPPRPFNAAAKLMIRLFQQGMTDPTNLANELDRQFGKSRKMETAFAGSPLHRFAIQGLPTKLRSIVH
ncbi:hypothetical protein EV128_10732 [Rhizobium azibense]|nr:hypothetical protein EV128_10732 [Rhizobium azibense]